MYKNKHVSGYRYTGRLQIRGNQLNKYRFMSYVQLSYVKYDMNMSYILLSTPGGYKRFTLGGRDTLCKVGPHDIKRSSVLASDRNFTGYVWD